MSTPNYIEHHAVKDSSNKKNARPIHGDWSNDGSIGPEAEEHGDHRVDQSDDIDNGTEDWSHFPRPPIYWVISKSFLEN